MVYASRTDGRVIRPGESFLGIPFDKLKVGMSIEEQIPGKGKVVVAKIPNKRERAKALGYPRDKLGNIYGPEKFDSDYVATAEKVRRSHDPGWVEARLAKAHASRIKREREAVAKLPPKETPREGLMKRLADDPRFVKAKESGIAYIIVGAKPSVSKIKARDRHRGDID